MRKTLFYAGIILFLAGLTFLAVSSTMQNVKQVVVKNTYDGWEISVSLEKESTYILDIMSSAYWRDDYTDGAYEEPQPVDLVIISPDGGETKLQAFFLARLPTSPYYKATFPSLVYVEYESVDSDSLEVDRDYPRVRFTVKQDGNYTARIFSDTLSWYTGPPREIIIYKEVVENQSMYPIFLQSGGILCLAGVVISILGVRAHKKSRFKKRKQRKTKK